MRGNLRFCVLCNAWTNQLRLFVLTQHWLEDDDLDRILKNYDDNEDGGLKDA